MYTVQLLAAPLKTIFDIKSTAFNDAIYFILPFKYKNKIKNNWLFITVCL